MKAIVWACLFLLFLLVVTAIACIGPSAALKVFGLFLLLAIWVVYELAEAPVLP